MPATVTVRGLQLGAGRPKICVPLVGATLPALLAEAQTALAAGAEIVELRADFMAATHHTGMEAASRALCEAAAALRVALGEVPLLFTLRGAAEGGQCPFGNEATAALLKAAAEGGAVDLLDVELSLGEALCRDVIAHAAAHGVKTIASHHRFDETPAPASMLGTLHAAGRAGADIAKLAVMPHTPADVLALLAATDEFHRSGGIPAITMSMGALGAVSRLCGEAFGSCVSFGAGQNASAPGQIAAGTMAEALDALRLAQ